MLAKEVMTKKPEYLPPTATLKEAAGLMSKGDFGFIPIGENDRLIGAVTDRDIAIRAVAKGKDPSKTSVKEVMSKGIQYCFEDD
ncbi:CBS domain-containing protein, partial [Klebsiella pneumoniae]|nr:CBS domain-containing protein [Klebsiella pneumoniae]